MSFNITCNTVVLNNYQSKPTYKEILASQSGHASIAQCHSHGKRSNCISSDAKLNMVSGDSGGRVNESKSRSRLEEQAKDVPENKIRDSKATDHPKWTKDSSNNQKLDEPHGKMKYNQSGKGNSDFKSAIENQTKPKCKSLPSNTETPRVSKSKAWVSKSSRGPKLNEKSKSEKGNCFKNRIEIGHLKETRLENIPLKFSKIKAPRRFTNKTKDSDHRPKVSKNFQSLKNNKSTPVVSNFYLNQLSDDLNETNEDSNETETPLFEPCPQANDPIFQFTKPKNNKKPLTVKKTKFERPTSSKVNNKRMPKYIESILNGIETYPSSKNHREIKINRLVKDIKKFGNSMLTGKIANKYLRLKRLLNQRKTVSKIRKENYYILMMEDHNEETKQFSLRKYDKFAVADTVETWKTQILEKGGSKMLKPLCEAEPVINEAEIRLLLTQAANAPANVNLDIETLALRFSTQNGTAWKRYTEQRAKIEEYRSNNARIFSLVQKACKNDVEVSTYCKQVERATPANQRHYMRGNELVTYILANFNRETNVHRAIIESEIYNLKIETTASEFLLKLDKHIQEAQRLGSTIDSTVVTETMLTRVLMSNPRYQSFYQVMMVNNPVVPGVANNIRINNYKLMIKQFDENNRILSKGTKRQRDTGYSLESDDENTSKSKDKSEIKCFKCNKMGHYARECDQKIKNNKNPKFNIKNDKNKFKPKSFKVKKFNKGCYKCGGNHKSVDCNYDFKRKVKFDFNKNKKREEKAYMSIDDIELQPGEDNYEPTSSDKDEDNQEYACMLVESDDEEEIESDGYGSSSKVFSYSICNTNDNSNSEIGKRKIDEITEDKEGNSLHTPNSTVSKLINDEITKIERAKSKSQIKHQKLLDRKEEKEFLENLEQSLREKELIDLTNISDEEHLMSNELEEEEEWEDCESDTEDQLEPLCYDKDEMKLKKEVMNQSEGEVFQMRIGDEDSDEDNEDAEVAFLDSGCSRTSLRNRKHFKQVLKAEGKSVNTANGKIKVK